MIVVGIRSARAADPVVRYVGRLLPRLVLVQIAIGVGNVLLGLPVWVSALHLANAAAILALSLVVTLRLAAMRPAADPALLGAPAR